MLEERLLDIGTVQRRYFVHTPVGHLVSRDCLQLPLVIMLHGTGGTGYQAALMTGWCEKADEVGTIVAFPDATPLDLDRPPHFRTNVSEESDLQHSLLRVIKNHFSRAAANVG